jgi:hypothetical protein
MWPPCRCVRRGLIYPTAYRGGPSVSCARLVTAQKLTNAQQQMKRRCFSIGFLKTSCRVVCLFDSCPSYVTFSSCSSSTGMLSFYFTSYCTFQISFSCLFINNNITKLPISLPQHSVTSNYSDYRQ